MQRIQSLFSLPWLLGVLAFNPCSVEAQTSQPATDPKLLESLRQIDAAVAKVKDLTTDFEQKKFSPLLKKPLISKGTVYARGSAMLWVTKTPQPTRMRIDATSLQIYYPDDKRIEQYPLQGKLAAMAANPLPRLETLMEQFDITQPPGPQPTDTHLHLVLTPKNDELKQYVKEVRVEIDSRTSLADHFDIVDPDGERTDIRFMHHKTDTGLTDADLALNAPPNTQAVQPLGPAGQ